MTQEEKQLLLKDLCARLPYDVMVDYESHIYVLNEIDPSCKDIDYITVRIQDVERLMCAGSVMIEDIKPYLRPMSSMTEEEKREYKHLIAFSGNPIGSANLIDWLNKKMFACRTIDDKDDKDMFELGLAIKVTEYNNPYD